MNPRELVSEICGVVLGGAGVFALAAVLSFDTADLPTHVAPGGEVHNACGALGVVVARALLEAVGTLGALGAGAIVLSVGASLLRRGAASPGEARPAPEPLRRAAGVLVLVLCLSLVERVVAGSPWARLVERGLPPGGWWGLYLEAQLARTGGVGAPIAAAVALVVGMVLLTDRTLRDLLTRSAGAAREAGAAAAQAAAQAAGSAAAAAAIAEDALASDSPVAGPAPAPAVATSATTTQAAAPVGAEPVELEDEELDLGDAPTTAPRPAAAATPTPAVPAFVPRAGDDEQDDEQDDEDEAEPEASDAGEPAAPAGPEVDEADEADEADELVTPISSRAGRPATPDLRPEPSLPSPDLLAAADERREPRARDDRGRLIEDTLAQFKVPAKVVSVEHGPSVALFALELGRGVKVQRVAGLLDNLALALRVPGIRLQAPIPGTSWVGLEVPNEEQEVVRLRELLDNPGWRKKDPALPVFLGKDSAGRPLIADLAKMPHLLIAGATGSGKSVCINSIIVSLLMTRTPRDVQLILIDPKQVEMTQFAKVPHLAAPVVTDMRKAGAVLDWAVRKMEERYGWLSKAGVRHIREYNALGKGGIASRLGVSQADLERDRTPWKLPYIVVVVDELNDLMMIAQKEVEASITRLAQKSRAVGIHVVLATQRPSVDVITGVIKSNLPARIAFRVTAKVDSRTILDTSGADKLLGMGDMLFLPPGRGQPMRALGALVTDDEVNAVVKAWSRQSKPEYAPDLQAHTEAAAQARGSGRVGSGQAARAAQAEAEAQADDARDAVYHDAVRVVLAEGKGSVSLIQRKLELGYGRASRYLDLMAEDGIVGPAKGSKPRDVKMTLDEWEGSRRAAA